MFFQVYYQKIYLITIIRDLANPSQCWFRASDLTSFMQSIIPKFAGIRLIYEFSFIFKDYSLLLDTNAPDYTKNGTDIYLNLDGIAFYFLLARAPNWGFFAWAKAVEEQGNNNHSELTEHDHKQVSMAQN